MKKFIVPLLMAFAALFIVPALSNDASAQIVKAVTISTTDSLLVSADTATISLTFDGSYKSVEAWFEETTGANTGKIYFEAKYPHNGISVTADWVKLDSLALVDQAAAQFKLFTVPNPRTYAAYRLTYVKAGAGSGRIKGFYLRYTGGWIPILDPGYQFASINDFKNQPMFSFIQNDPGTVIRRAWIYRRFM